MVPQQEVNDDGEMPPLLYMADSRYIMEPALGIRTLELKPVLPPSRRGTTGGLTRHQQQKKPPETGPPWHDRHLWWLIKNHGH